MLRVGTALDRDKDVLNDAASGVQNTLPLTGHTGLSRKKPSEECFETVVLKTAVSEKFLESLQQRIANESAMQESL